MRVPLAHVPVYSTPRLAFRVMHGAQRVVTQKGLCPVSVALMPRLPIGLCVYGISYSTGYVGKNSPRAHPHPLTAPDFLDLAVRLGLSSVEMPLSYIAADESPAKLADFAAQVAEHGLGLVIDGPMLEVATFRRHLEQAHAMGATVVRCMLSHVLCGERGAIGGLEGWRRHLEEMARRLAEVAPVAEDLGLCIGVENHQDATSDDLVWLCETVNSPAVGVTLDTGNPLAVAEDPVRFAQRVLPHLVHVHLKDYRMVQTPHGYRLFHCAVGTGVVDFAALFDLFATVPGLVPHIEMAWLGERHIRILDEDWWAGFEPRPMATLLPLLRRWQGAERNVEWRTPWEIGEDDVLPAWEMARLEESIARLRTLLTATPA